MPSAYPEAAIPGELYRINAPTVATEHGLDEPADWYFPMFDWPSWASEDGYSGDGNINAVKGTPPLGTADYTFTILRWGDLSETYDIPGLAPEPVVTITAPAPVFDALEGVVTIPEAEGVTYWEDVDELEPGPHIVEPGTAITVTAQPADGYALEGVTEWTFSADEPEPEPDDQYAVWLELVVPRVERMMGGRATEARTATATDAVDVVTAYVDGYTGGFTDRGWTESGVPDRRITAVIVVAAVRLASNPRQVTMYTTSDYTERPAVLAGWTLAERAVLRRYRRTQA